MKVRKEKNTIVSQKKLKRRTIQRAGAEARAAALGRLGFFLSAAQEPVAAAQYIVDASLEFFQWDAGFLVLYDAASGRVNDLVNIDTLRGQRQRVPAVLQDKPPSPMMRKVIEEGPQLILRNVALDPSRSTVPFGDKGRLSLSLMFVPVRLENKSIGVLSVQSYEPQAYDQNDLEALQELADHAAGALGRLQAEAKLRASEERLRLAIESSGLGTWEYAPATNEFACSQTCAKILGLVPGREASFDSFLAQLPADGFNSPAKLLHDTLENTSAGPLHLECRLCRPDQTQRWIILAARRFLAVQEPTVFRLIGTVLDITERKQVEQELRSAEEKLQAHTQELEKTVAQRTARLEQTVAELEHFSYALMHDMRAPLRAMQVFAQLIEQELADCKLPASMEYLRRIRTASGRLDQLIRDSLSYNKAVRENLVLNPINLAHLLTGLIETYPQLQPGSAEITLEKELPAVLGNEAALTQCFSNLLDNAVKFKRPGQKACIRIWSETRGEHVRVWVEDQGIGIPKPAQERIFEMFQRATNEYQGTGIGLTIVRKVVQRMGGTVGVESQEGQGSRFWVEFKSAKDPAPPKGQPGQKPGLV